jgi:nicotinamidase-related amidase
MLNNGTRFFLMAATCAALGGCSGLQPSQSSSAAPAAASTALPPRPAPVPVTLDARTSVLLVLDINEAVCTRYPACVASVPAIASLVRAARAANVPVVYSTTPGASGPSPVLAAVAPQAGEPTVSSRANKFTDTNLEEILKQRKAATLVMVGAAANGAVLYTAYHANSRGFTVVVADDGIASAAPTDTAVARYQLLNQPGYANAGNKPLAERMVTLSRGDLIRFQ